MTWFADLGRMGYREAHRLQEALVAARQRGKIDDVLLFVEHSPTLTLGKAASAANILAGPAELAARGFEVHRIERGGDVTYHGPGQLVGYPILDLGSRGRDLHRYVRDLEEVLIRTLADYSVEALRKPGYPGVWVGGRKIAALGIAVKKWVTMHGFAFNVSCELTDFDVIVPCGIAGCSVTSLSEVLGRAVSLAEASERVKESFADVFGTDLADAAPEHLLELAA